ncbi:protoporphyrinogen oxidase [Desulfosporosinus fructosivorans]|uniref:Protoporphyrinogen oxidase n=1 Tax=Desulfosporosinus fructosivorans TaxID=2018669 RepID=A0A4Z0R3B8_9FIRM|nr:protoporphyrinogen oxidase [Desulfosporosinus fructosivorans]TGE36875.1 protoporphyrinogen oxidase [Desulfosporosinus fructosivorans]
MPDDKPNNQMVGSDILAELFGVSTRRIQQFTKEGVIVSTKVKGSNCYDLMSTIKQYIKHLGDKANNRESKSSEAMKIETRKSNAEADFKESKAGMAALEFNELEGKMHRSEDVEAMTTALVFSIRSMIMALPGRLAIDVANTKTAAEASERIKQECHGILNDLSNYRYDPEEYKRRVRDRKGWREMEEDGQEG